MNRTLVVALALVVLLSGATATAAAFTDGDEVAPDSEVYLDAADSDNGDRYVQIDEADEVRLQFDALPPGSQTRVDDLFVVGFAGYEDSDNATTVRLESTDDRVTIERMGTAESFDSGTVTLRPEESAVFGATVSTDTQSFSGTIELDVDVPEENADGSGAGGGSGGDTDGSEPASVDGDDADVDGDSTDGAGEEGADEETADPADDAAVETDDGTDGDAADRSADGSETDSAAVDSPAPTPEPAGLALGGLPAEWLFFGGFLAAFTNYLVQTRVRGQSPVMRLERSVRRDRLKSVLLREIAVGAAVFLATLLVAGALSGVGVTGATQTLATLAFSAGVGGVTGYRLFPALDLDVTTADTGSH